MLFLFFPTHSMLHTQSWPIFSDIAPNIPRKLPIFQGERLHSAKLV